MEFKELSIKGAYLIEEKPINDIRGHFTRIMCKSEFENHNISADFVQNSISSNKYKNTLRGMHYQRGPFEEEKLVKCIRGKIYDVILDLRPNSETLYKWVGVELSDCCSNALYIPKGCAHGFLTLEDDTEVLYQITQVYAQEYADGVKYDDPKFRITWPWLEGERIISDKDLSYPLLEK